MKAKSLTSDDMNTFFDQISHDIYERPELLEVSENFGLSVEKTTILNILLTIKKSSLGSSQLPFWTFKEFAYELLSPITHLINCILNKGNIYPDTYKKELITPIPKLS